MISSFWVTNHKPAPRWTTPTGREGNLFFGPVLIIISRIRSRRLHSSEQPDSGLPELTGSRHIHPGPVLGRSRTPKYRKDDHERPSPGHQSWTL